MAKRTGNAAAAPKKAVPVAGGASKKTPQKGKGVRVGAAGAKTGGRKGKGKPGAKGGEKPSKDALDGDLDTYMRAAAPEAPAAAPAAAAAAPMAE
jgi:hypothetical protein